jgi:hypothetical protein
MDNINNETSTLRDLVPRYRVCWEVWPENAMVDGKVRQIGFELELSGTHPPEVKNFNPGCHYCQEVFGALLRIAKHILPPNSGQPSEYNIDPYEQRISYSQKRGSRPDVSLKIHIVHRQGFRAVDDCEQRCLGEMERRLATLGVPQGGWTQRRAVS